MLIAATALPLYAETPVTQTYTIEGGAAMMADTYLTPLRYHGARAAVTGRWTRGMGADPEHLGMEINAQINSAFTRNPARNAWLYDLDVHADWGMSYTWTPAPRWRISAGGAAGFTAGCFYLPRNGNNPATAKADIMLSLRAAGEWDFRLGSLPVTLSDRVTLPSVGAFFSQGYGEPYYEIYLGNRDGLAHFGWWGNHFCIDNLLSAELHFRKRSLLIGYRFKTDSSWVNSINSQLVSHSLVIGVTFGPQSLRTHKPSEL